jgi:two-component system chemotaxis response regulator CheB
MNPIRVLIVDDSVLARRLITNALSAHSEISVVGTAENGALALTKLPQLAVDAVILDVEMPDMDGITTLKLIRELYPRLPVLMFSTLTERSARVTFEALAAGANDYALKPSSSGGETLENVIAQVVVPKLVAIVRNPSPANGNATRSGNGSGTHRPVSASGAETPLVVALGSATGGPNALADVIPLLPRDLPVPILVAQHMPPIFTRCLAERLAERSQVRVIESQGDEILVPGTVYVAPGGFHLELMRDGDVVKTRLGTSAPEHSCRPAVDVLFRSVAAVFGKQALGVVLTGMGSDGKLGAQAIVDAGGRVLAQSGPSCVVWGMPRAVEEAGLCERVVPLNEIARAICERVNASAARTRSSVRGA